MDVNGSRYHLLLGAADWGTCTDANTRVGLAEAWTTTASPMSDATTLYWDATKSQLSLLPLVYPFATGRGDLPRALTDRRGSSADKFGNWYFIDASQSQILVWSAGDQATSAFWRPTELPAATARGGAFGPLRAPAPRALRPLSAAAVTSNHYLVVGATAPGALLIFDLYAGGGPREILWPPEVPFAPFDMAPAPGGGVYVLDAANHRYWTLDASFSVCSLGQGTLPLAPPEVDVFQPLAGGPTRQTPARDFPSGNLLGAASPLAAASPISIESLPDGSVLVLDRGDGKTSFIEHYRGGTLLEPPYPIDTMASLLPQGVTLDFTAHDLAFVPAPGADPLAGRVLVALATGNQCLAFASSSNPDGTLRLTPLPDYYPMRLFGGRAIVTANGAPYYDFSDRFVPLLSQRRPRYVEDGALVTRVFDGGAPGCVWHRLILDGTIPLDTTVQVSSRAADDLATLAETPFSPEPPRLVQRSEGSELPFASLPAGLSSWELLFQQARGRYMQLQLELGGNGKHSPRIRALRAYYPRFSYLKEYLPKVYADSDARGFLGRFLANIEGTLTSIEGRIAAAQTLFDPVAAPPDTLEWLAGWFSVAIDPSWDDVRRRLFIRHAMDLFQWRGTVRGIQMALDLALSQTPCDAIFTRDDNLLPSGTRIIEQFATRLTPGVVVGDPTETSYVPSKVASSGASGTWTPDQGGARLASLWTLAASAAGLPSPASFSVSAPSDAATAAAWTAFSRATLGFVPSSTTADQMRWMQFLYHRYLTVSALNAAYGATYASFANALRPTTLPPDGPQLLDWYQFEGVVMGIAQSAHRFRVLIPLVPGASADSPEQQQKLDLVTRLVQLEQPAHTTFDVRFYYAMFRVGQVRLGYDTLLDQGSRVPALAPAMVLGATHLLEGHLSPSFPQDAADRKVLGRDPLGPAGSTS